MTAVNLRCLTQRILLLLCALTYCLCIDTVTIVLKLTAVIFPYNCNEKFGNFASDLLFDISETNKSIELKFLTNINLTFDSNCTKFEFVVTCPQLSEKKLEAHHRFLN